MNLLENTMIKVLKTGALKVVDLDKGEKPFKYTSGNYGPGYIALKEIVGRKHLMKQLTIQLASKIARDNYYLIDFVASIVTGGVVPGVLLSEYLSDFIGYTLPLTYVDTKPHNRTAPRIIGTSNNPIIKPGAKALVVDELINFASTTTDVVELLRDSGYIARRVACILFYGNEVAKRQLSANNVEVIYLFSLPKLLYVARKHGFVESRLADEFFDFINDPDDWQKRRVADEIS